MFAIRPVALETIGALLVWSIPAFRATVAFSCRRMVISQSIQIGVIKYNSLGWRDGL